MKNTLLKSTPKGTAKKPSNVRKTELKKPKGIYRPRIKKSREYLRTDEVEKLIAVAKKNGLQAHRNATMIMLAYKHGLRATELCNLTWDCINLDNGTIYIDRLKDSSKTTHCLQGDEIRALNRLKREQPKSRYVFLSRLKTPLTKDMFRKIVTGLGKIAELDIHAHPHMLRHACGYALANKGTSTRDIQYYLGHKQIRHTVQYTELAEDRFKHIKL